MIKTMKYFLIMAGSTSHMLRGDKLLKDEGIDTALVPAPSEYGSVCAIAIRVAEESLVQAEKILAENKIVVLGVYSDIPKKLSGLVERLSQSVVSDSFLAVLQKVEEGEELDFADIVLLLSTERRSELEALYLTADRMRQEIIGDVVDIRGAIEFSNTCRKDCNYCGIRDRKSTRLNSSHH